MIKAKHFLIFILSIFNLNVNAQGIRWLEKSCNFGTFNENLGKVEAKYRFINESSSPVNILSVRTNCGCTTPRYPQHSILPGDTATITAAYDPDGRPGKFLKYVTVDLENAGKNERAKLELSGVVIGSERTLRNHYPIQAGDAKLKESYIMFNAVTRGTLGVGSLPGINPTADTILPRLSRVPEYINATIVPEKVGPGEMFIISAILDSDKTNDWGLKADSLKLNDTNIDLTVILKEDFSHLTAQEMANAPICYINSGNREFTISNPGKSALKIRKIYSYDPCFSLSYSKKELKAGKSMKVKVKTHCENLENPVARITIITNDPLHPEQTIKVIP